MPELPEMENYKLLLNNLIAGKMITAVTIQREKSINVPVDEFTATVTNQTITSISRRAKYIIFHLQNGMCLLLHLMLGGWMFYGKDEDKPKRTVQVRLSFGDQHLHFIGLRLGYLHLLSPEQVQNELEKKLGLEPLHPSFTFTTFQQRLKGRKGIIKSALINQQVIAGIGNGYSDEILWHAQMLPKTKITDLTIRQLNQLYESIQFIMKKGLAEGGYMGNPLYKGDGKTGGYKFYVHAREGEACLRCQTFIQKEVISSRKAYFCPNCQQ